ncbi:hypothetical protein J5500_04115 [Candidatus Saccharibacteria bacterium]|nr:hypothetical protein [Candidatus Saccharibacteria bacterium]
MLIVGFLQWWYVRGWLNLINKMMSMLRSLADSFSISLLLKTLFSPYKQISAYGSGEISFQAQISDFFDKLLSRVIGMILRLIIIFIGIIVIVLDVVMSSLAILLWPLLPILPIVCVILTIVGVTF